MRFMKDFGFAGGGSLEGAGVDAARAVATLAIIRKGRFCYYAPHFSAVTKDVQNATPIQL
jgi:hypothetical protein